MLEGIEVLCHSNIKISKNKIIYIDPFKIDKEYKDADYIFITHSHYDHFSLDDINKVRKENTKIILPLDMYDLATQLGFNDKNILTVTPNEKYEIDTLQFETVPAYNVNKNFHPKSNNWVGYIIRLDNISYYIAGDTDITEENKKVVADVIFVPVGGTYTTTCKEAAELANHIMPKIAVPTHYGCIVGCKSDAEEFVNLLNDNIKGVILIK